MKNRIPVVITKKPFLKGIKDIAEVYLYNVAYWFKFNWKVTLEVITCIAIIANAIRHW